MAELPPPQPAAVKIALKIRHVVVSSAVTLAAPPNAWRLGHRLESRVALNPIESKRSRTVQTVKPGTARRMGKGVARGTLE